MALKVYALPTIANTMRALCTYGQNRVPYKTGSDMVRYNSRKSLVHSLGVEINNICKVCVDFF